MVIGIKDIMKLFAITIVTCCTAFVCTLFLNYNVDIAGIKGEIITQQGRIIYDAQVASGKLIACVAGGCLIITSAVMLIFYVKNYIDSHGKELGILKALGYSDFRIAKHFWVFGLSVFIGCVLGYMGASLYMPVFYEIQNKEQLLPALLPEIHFEIAFCVIVLPAAFFALLSVFYSFFKLKSPVIDLLKEVQRTKVKIGKKERKDMPFLEDLKRNTLRSRKILVFFIGFSAFCFSSMMQMSMSMGDLASEEFSWIMISIGLILAFMMLFLSLTTVVKANTKTIAMMKVFGYSRKECGRALLSGYRPVSYIGFVLGTLYQYFLLRITVDIVFSDFENMPGYDFNVPALFLSLSLFLVVYELILFWYSRKIGSLSVKGIMLE